MKTAPVTHVGQTAFRVATTRRGLVEITGRIRDAVSESSMHDGIVHVFVHHTSCSLMIGENADPTVCADLDRFFARLVPDGDPLFEHVDEGPDDMPAHVRSMLSGVHLSIPVTDAVLALGTWQGVFLWEHRTRPHERRVTLTLIGI